MEDSNQWEIQIEDLVFLINDIKLNPTWKLFNFIQQFLSFRRNYFASNYRGFINLNRFHAGELRSLYLILFRE